MKAKVAVFEGWSNPREIGSCGRLGGHRPDNVVDRELVYNDELTAS
jgi:hypothetical protein